MNNENTTFNLNGTPCFLSISQDDDGDCIKLWHDLVNVNTNEVVATLGWSPYSCPTDAEVEQLIGLGEVILGEFHLPCGLRWANSHPLSRFNFDSDSLALYLSGEEIDKSHGKLELVFRVGRATAV